MSGPSPSSYKFYKNNLPVTMEARDAIITWLEQSNNFLRVMTLSPVSPSTSRGRGKLAQAESQALKELATYVNLSIPRTNWDAKHARLMLKHYLMEYRSTAEAAANLQLSLDEKDKLRGFKTVQEKLNDKCRHFQRLQQLHTKFTMKEKQAENPQNNEHDKQTTFVKSQLDLTDSQCKRREKEVVPKKIGTDKKVKTNFGVTVDENKEKTSRENIVTEATLATNTQNKKKEGKSHKKMKMRSKSKEQQLKEKNVVPESLLIALSSDEEYEEALPMLRRSTRSKRQASKSPEKSNDRSHDAFLWINKRKLQRVESASETTTRVSDVTPTQTTQTSSSASNGPQGSPVNDENTPSVNTSSQATENKRKFPTSKLTQPASSSLVMSRRKRPVKNAVSHPVTKGRNPASAGQKSTQSTAVPNALRSAIAQAVSQRQQLLSRSQAEQCQYSASESDYDLSDIDVPEPSASHQRSSDGIRHEARPSIGLLPPLIDRLLTTDGRASLEQKRVFLRAKELAFEQLKWQRENEFQQQELELLRYEMEARKALARQEMKIKRMRIRAAIIQPMISAGASAADIAERLKLL